MATNNFEAYLKALRGDFIKLCRLRFLQPDGSTAFTLDNNPQNPRSTAFIAQGSISMNWQNGRRRTADVTLYNADGEYDYNVNSVWYGTEIALDEGLVLPDGSEYYIQQGVFLILNPEEALEPNQRTITLHLADKSANLDGTLLGCLDGTYEVEVGTNVFAPIVSLLAEDRGNGMPLDRTAPIFTEYYNGRTQLLPDGSTVLLTDTPYTLTIDAENGTVWNVIEGLCAMINAWVGYDESGALRIDPSQDDISDADKPIVWRFGMNEAQLLGASYTLNNTEVYNDYIVLGEMMDDNSQPSGRAQNLDPASDTNIQTIGRKTKREARAGYFTNTQCVDYANWMLKRSSILQKSVSISCSQMFHIHGNDLVTITRADKTGSPTERHLVQGFTRPLIGTAPMTIDAVSVVDIPQFSVSVGGKNAANLRLIPAAASVITGSTTTLTASWLGDGALTVTSNDTSVASVSVSGNTITVTGVSDGTTSLIATVAETETYSADSAVASVIAYTVITVAIPEQSGQLTYNGTNNVNGTAQSPTWSGYDVTSMRISGTTSAINAGTYTATFILLANRVWSDGTTEPKNVSWSIGKQPIDTVTASSTRLIYDGTAKIPSWTNYSADTTIIGGTTTAQTEAGSYSTTFTPRSNFQWNGGDSGTITIVWEIAEPGVVALPTQSGTLTYTGAAQSPTWSGYSSQELTIGGTTSGTNAGTYYATFTPNDGYVWSDGTQTEKQAAWVIGKALINVLPTQSGTLTYNGTVQQPTFSNYDPNKLTIGGDVSAENAGTYTATFTPTDNYDWGDV